MVLSPTHQEDKGRDHSFNASILEDELIRPLVDNNESVFSLVPEVTTSVLDIEDVRWAFRYIDSGFHPLCP